MEDPQDSFINSPKYSRSDSFHAFAPSFTRSTSPKKCSARLRRFSGSDNFLSSKSSYDTSDNLCAPSFNIPAVWWHSATRTLKPLLVSSRDTPEYATIHAKLPEAGSTIGETA